MRKEERVRFAGYLFTLQNSFTVDHKGLHLCLGIIFELELMHLSSLIRICYGNNIL